VKKKRILAMILAVASCLSLAVSASAAGVTNRKATDFKDFDRTAWYADAVSAAVDNGLLYGKSATIIDPNGDMTRAEMAAIINRSFGCYAKADISKYKDVSKDKWYFEDVAMAVQMGTYNGRSNSSMAPDAPITRQEAMTVVARALELDYDAYAKTDLSGFSDRSEISNWALPYVRATIFTAEEKSLRRRTISPAPSSHRFLPTSLNRISPPRENIPKIMMAIYSFAARTSRSRT